MYETAEQIEWKCMDCTRYKIQFKSIIVCGDGGKIEWNGPKIERNIDLLFGENIQRVVIADVMKGEEKQHHNRLQFAHTWIYCCDAIKTE